MKKILMIIVLSTLFVVNGYSNSITVKKLPYDLEGTKVYLEIYTSGKSGLVYYHPHEDEKTSYEVGKSVIQKLGGVMYAVQQDGNRLVEFNYDGVLYQIDPNRMFNKQGIRDNLEKYSKQSSVPDKAVDIVYNFAMWVVKNINSARVFAIHNNYNKGYNVKSYIDAQGNPVKGVGDIYINPKRSTGNFVYTTNKKLFTASKNKGYNSVLQDDEVTDDGSYSVYASKHEIDYVNVEATRGDNIHDRELILFVNEFYGYK